MRSDQRVKLAIGNSEVLLFQRSRTLLFTWKSHIGPHCTNVLLGLAQRSRI
jgi:hypothetical protein